ncbi:MAG: hypothetical protein IKG89_06725 [Oscillospiraceae bacterium]|nr:hypothetical protein [Oscillospiraceae bacterium]
MKSLNERQVNDQIRRAAAAMTPNHAEELWEKPVEKASGDVWYLEEAGHKKTKASRNYRGWAGLAAACFALVFIGWFQLFRTPDATICLDVNPSVSVEVNRLGRVVRAEADNEDGRIILDNMKLRNTHIDTAMNALLGSMVRHGYLSPAQNTLLISVNGRNESRTESLRQRVSEDAEQTLRNLLGNSIILGQTIKPDAAAEELAGKYGITPGKATLILRLLQDHPAWDMELLTGMPMTGLIKYCRAAGIDISGYLGDGGEVLGDWESLLDPEDPDDNDDREDNDHEDPYDDDDPEDDDHEDPCDDDPADDNHEDPHDDDPEDDEHEDPHDDDPEEDDHEDPCDDDPEDDEHEDPCDDDDLGDNEHEDPCDDDDPEDDDPVDPYDEDDNREED